MYACYELLEQIGWRFLAEDVDFIRPAAEKDIAGLDLTESSVFADRRIYTGTFNYSEDMRNKLRDIDTRAFAGGACHTFDNLDGDYSTQSENQPCLTDPAVYELMLKNVMKLLENNPSANFISISQNDNGNYCKCDNCMAAMKKYEDENGKGGPAGLMIEFVNKFALEIEKKYGIETALRVELTGEVEPHFSVPKNIENDAFGLYFFKLIDKTLPLYNTEQYQRDMSVKGEIFREFYPMLTSEDEEERLITAQAFRIALAALENREIDV